MGVHPTNLTVQEIRFVRADKTVGPWDRAQKRTGVRRIYRREQIALSVPRSQSDARFRCDLDDCREGNSFFPDQPRCGGAARCPG